MNSYSIQYCVEWTGTSVRFYRVDWEHDADIGYLVVDIRAATLGL